MQKAAKGSSKGGRKTKKPIAQEGKTKKGPQSEAHGTVGKYKHVVQQRNTTEIQRVCSRVAAGTKKKETKHVVQQGDTRKTRGLVRVSPLAVASHLPFVSKSLFVCFCLIV